MEFKLSLWQRFMLQGTKLLHFKERKRERTFYNQLRLYGIIRSAITNDNYKIALVDGNNETTIVDISELLKLNNIRSVMDYKVQDDKIIFNNGSQIEIIKTDKNDVIRGRRNKCIQVYDDYPDCDLSVLNEFINKEENDNERDSRNY